MPTDHAPTPHDPYDEMVLLHMAYKILKGTEQLNTKDDKRLAKQVRNVLKHGTRQPGPRNNTAALTYLKHHFGTTPAAPMPTEADCGLDDETIRADIHGYTEVDIPNYDPIYFPQGQPEPEGYTIPERVCQLDYRLSADEYAAHMPRLGKLAREAWASQFPGEPTHKDHGDWYDVSDATWLDPLIRSYLAQFHGIAQLPRVKE